MESGGEHVPISKFIVMSIHVCIDYDLQYSVYYLQL